MAIREATALLIDQVNAILGQYDGPLTLRQLYYRLVAAHTIENTERQYKRLSAVLTKARLSGAVDDTRIVDRLRQVLDVQCWSDLSAFLAVVRRSYRREKWSGQQVTLEVWCEKDAVAGVLQPITERWEVPLFPVRGYGSYSALREAAERFRRSDKPNLILYLGDFDPSGQDMPRDIRRRLNDDFGAAVELQVLALTPEQIARHGLPPAPAKRQDTRAAAFIAEHGDVSVELDALPPDVLQGLVDTAVRSYVDLSAWRDAVDAQEIEERELAEIIGGL